MIQLALCGSCYSITISTNKADVHVLVYALSLSFSSRRLNKGSAVVPKQMTKMIKLTVQGLVTRANTSKSCNRRTEWKERTNEERRNRISLGCGNCPVAQRQNGSESRTHVLCIQSCWGACRLDQVGAKGEEEEEEGGGEQARESRGREGSLQWPVVLCHTPCMPACLQTQANEQGVGETSAPAATLSPGEIRPCASPIASTLQASLSAL